LFTFFIKVVPMMKIISRRNTTLEFNSDESFYTDSWEASPADVTKEDIIGIGNFGLVRKGFLAKNQFKDKRNPQPQQHTPVALKYLKGKLHQFI